MNKSLLLIPLIIFSSCNWFKQKGKEVANKTGEAAATVSSEFVEGASKGIEKTFVNEVVFSDDLKKAGVTSGKIIISSTDSATDDIVRAYLIFNNDFQKEITVKVFSPEGIEYGRVKETISAKKDDAKYVDFVFDKRTNIDSKGKITFE
jgi:hypothetical protein